MYNLQYFFYRFMTTDTIEKRILDLQEKKLGVANAMLTGTKQAIVNKLSLQDLKMLFEMWYHFVPQNYSSIFFQPFILLYRA